ncbi:hypothetical protein [Dactylosporangium sp. CA-139066]|uniref:hypothetical protein n=1 Tax=Dactylosporangium sp. CA-139066 TaxID=3239930 RepID=UPI003D941CA4
MTDKRAEEAMEVLYGNALRELEEADEEAGEQPLSEADRDQVRAYIRTGYRPGMSAEEAAALQAAAVDDLLRTLEFEPGGALADLLPQVRALGEVITKVKEAREAASAGS